MTGCGGAGDGLTRTVKRESRSWKLIASSIGNKDEALGDGDPGNSQYRADLEMAVIDELRDGFIG